MSHASAPRMPAGVTLVAILAWLSATLHIVVGSLVLAGVLHHNGTRREDAWVSIGIGVIALLVSLGLFRRSRVARAMVTVSLVLSLLAAVLAAIARPSTLAASAISGALALLGLLLLYTRKADRYFDG